MKKIRFILLIWCSLWLTGCHDSEDVGRSSRTVLVYMAADNSLSRYGYENMELMLKGLQVSDGNLIVYFDPSDGVPSLFQLTYEKGKAVQKVIRTYEEENSASAAVLRRVLSETRQLFPADSYGLILWSHGLGWLPVDYSFPGGYRMRRTGDIPPTKYFASDEHPGTENGKGILIEELAEALPYRLNFILFDACFMSSVEVLYALRDQAEYIIASPAEVIANGFPYDRIVPCLWGDEEAYKRVCREYYDYYSTHPNGGSWQSATIALVKTSELEGLAREVREVLRGRMTEMGGLASGSVRRYTLIQYVPDVFFDLGEYIRTVGTAEQYAAFKAQADKTVIYKAATDAFNDVPLPAEEYSGLSTYVPLSRWAGMNTVYAGSDWAKAVY